MPLPEPPIEAGSLSGIPKHRLAGGRMYRVWRRDLPGGETRESPWWFASVLTDNGENGDDPAAGGRFDLPAPAGTCYFGTRPEAALLEALQMRLVNLPRTELAVRRIAGVHCPDAAPDAAMLTSRRLTGRFGINAELWAGRDRALTRRWAAALRRDGWWALYAGICHDPTGRLRAVALFDHAGAHPPSHAGRWRATSRPVDGDRKLEAALARYGVTVREPGQLPWARPGRPD